MGIQKTVIPSVHSEKITIMPIKQGDVSLHSHDFLELVYVTNGRAVHTLNDKTAIVKKGDYFIIDYGALHKYDTKDEYEFEIVNCLFRPEIIDKTLFNCFSFQNLINNYLIKFNYQSLNNVPTNYIFKDEDNSIKILIEKLAKEYEAKNPGYIELMRCYLIEIIIITMRKISKKDTDLIYNNYSEYIIKYVEENYMKPITLTDLSYELNFSLPYISKRFKNDMGVSFTEYLQKKRVEQGCRLIANTEKKMSEIAELVGYADVKFFNKVFKKQLKMTPRQFKKLHE